MSKIESFRGKLIGEMSKEELLIVIEHLGYDNQRLREEGGKHLDFALGVVKRRIKV